MSFLLDALRKSEHQKRIGDVPTIYSAGEPQFRSHSMIRPGILMLILLPAIIVVAWYFWPATKPVGTTGEVKAKQVGEAASIGLVEDALIKSSALPAFAGPAESAAPPKTGRTPVETFTAPVSERAKKSSVMALAVNSATKSEVPAEVISEVEPTETIEAEITNQETEHSGRPRLDSIGYWQLPASVRAELPPLKITVLVFAQRPEDRFILLNGRRVAEGDEPVPGLVLVEIGRAGAVFRYRLYRFLVSRWSSARTALIPFMDSGIVSNWSKAPAPVPWATIGITFICILGMLVYTVLSPMQQQAMIDVAGAIPADTAMMLKRAPGDWLEYGMPALFANMFVHASWLHLVGNLAYLWVFGVTVEQKLGALFMLALFLLGGALANVMVAMRLPLLDSPVIGASGAVSAVVGAYLGLFPGKRIGLYLPLGLYFQFARVPAILVIGSWFTLQLVYSDFGPITGAVTWWTHLAGFALGLIFAMLARALAQLRF